MGRVFQTSTPRRSQSAAAAPLPAKMASGSRQKDKANYLSFHNVEKTKLSARYPFLPSNQIERRIKKLWANASEEKKATFCSSLSGTTPVKSPFRGTILKGLVRRIRSGSASGPLLTSPSDGKRLLKVTHGILRSSEKKRFSTPRVSFRLDSEPMPSPIPVHHHTKRSLSGYLQAVGTASHAVSQASADYSGTEKGQKILDKGVGSPWKESTQERTPSADLDGPVVDDVPSTADVNIVQPINNRKKNGKDEDLCAAQQRPDESCSLLSGRLENKQTAGDFPPTERANKPSIRQSQRYAAITARTKIMGSKKIEPEGNIDNIPEMRRNLNDKSQTKTNVHYRLKKTDLSLEERKMYEFDDDDNTVKGSLDQSTILPEGRSVIMTRPRLCKSGAAAQCPRNPEEYNLDSNINKVMFGQDSPSPTIHHTDKPERFNERPEKICEGGTKNAQPKKKRGRPRKLRTPAEHQKEASPSQRNPKTKKAMSRMPPKGKAHSTSKDKNKPVLAMKDTSHCSHARPDENNDESYDQKDVPWMVSAHPSTSSDEDEEDCEDSDPAVYQHYQHESEGSSAQLSTPESDNFISSSQKVCEGFENFCRNGRFLATNNVDTRHVSSLESLLPTSPLSSDVGTGDQDILVSSPIHSSEVLPIPSEHMSPRSPALDTALFPGSAFAACIMECPERVQQRGSPRMGPSRKYKMRLENGECSDSSQMSDIDGCSEDVGGIVRQTIPNARKRKAEQQTTTDASSREMVPCGSPRDPGTRRTRTSSRTVERMLTGNRSKGKTVAAVAKRANEGEGMSNTRSVPRKCNQDAVDFDSSPGQKQKYDGAGVKRGLPSQNVTLTSRGSPEKLSRSILSDRNCQSNGRTDEKGSLGKCRGDVKLGGVGVTRPRKMNQTEAEDSKDLSVVRRDANGEKREQKSRKLKEESCLNQAGAAYCEDDENNMEEKRRSRMRSDVEELAPSSDGILCDLFPSRPPSQRPCRLIIPAQEQEDPVSTHLFLEENFFS